ncbi:hypothetical protein PR002_g25641 [Phytophthora rubi]|uniref:CCHC-type domain-containing protein n=2 Tax=Phytophthora rubi TaxID=129364 RepID=A0A6A3HX78_9STRA|nr:hypothetical protein PR002_g25641 [Phytophthora rubi]
MSPTRAGQSQSPAPGVDDTAREVSTNEGQAGSPLDENAIAANDGSLSRSDAERLIRTLVGIQGGRSLAEALFEGLRDLHSAPHPANSAETLPVSNLSPSQTSRDDPRDLPPMDNMNPGGRYDDKELAQHTKALVSSPPIKLPKLQSKSDYKSWRSEVPLHFDTRMLGAITYGTERYDEAEGLRRAKYHEWFEARKNKVFSALALLLSVDLRTTFKIDDIRDNMDAAALLFTRITQHFEAGDGIYPDYLLQELVTRRLKSGETVTAYVDDVARKINNHDHRSLKLAEAVQRLRVVEHQREQLRGQTGQSASQALKVSQVSAGQGQGQGQGASRKRCKQQRKRSKNVADKKQKTNCANCGGNGHWYSECTASTGIPLRPDLAEKDKARKQRQKKAPSSLVTYVSQTDSGAATRSQFAGLSLCGGQGNSDTDGQTSGTTPIYQDQPPSPTYSPTSKAESDDEDDHPATGNVPSTPQQLQLQPTIPDRQVQHVATPAVQPAPPAVQPTPPAVQPAPPATQLAAPAAVQSQWEGTRLLGPPPSWESLFYYVGQ